MKDSHPDLDVERSGRNTAISNGAILLKLVHRDGGYAQEFYGIDSDGRPRLVLSTIHRNLIPFTEHRMTSDPMFSTRRQHLFEVTRDSLRMAFSDARTTKTDKEVSVRLTGKLGDNTLSSVIVVSRGSKFVRVTLEAEFGASSRRPLIEYLMATYAFLPDGTLLDHYVRPDYAWAPVLRPENDHVIGERSFRTAAVLVQRKKLLAALIPDAENPRTLPVALDLDLKNGLISAPLLSYGYCDSETDGVFSRHDFSMVLRPETSRLSFSFYIYVDADAKTAAGYEPVQEFIWNMSRTKLSAQPAQAIRTCDSLASAYALKASSCSEEDDQCAEAVIQQTLSLQRPAGVFGLPKQTLAATAYDTEMTSKLCRWLLAIHRDFGPGPRLLQACRAYGDFLVSDQLSSGAIPAYFSQELYCAPEHRQSPLTAASGRFLAELYQATGERMYLLSACQAAKFTTNLSSRHRYRNRDDNLDGAPSIQDTHTMIRPQKSSAIRHVADLFIALYTLTGENRYLKSGLPALAQMCWFQDTWTNRIGAFGAGNTLAEDEDHAAFGRTLLEYYMATRRPEHIERGIAAIRAGLAIGDPAAAAVQHWAIRKFGSALVDVRNHTAYAVGLCHVKELSVKSGTIALDLHNGLTPGNNHPTTVKFHGLRGESYRVTINGEGKRYPKVELETGIKVAL